MVFVAFTMKVSLKTVSYYLKLRECGLTKDMQGIQSQNNGPPFSKEDKNNFVADLNIQFPYFVF